MILTEEIMSHDMILTEEIMSHDTYRGDNVT